MSGLIATRGDRVASIALRVRKRACRGDGPLGGRLDGLATLCRHAAIPALEVFGVVAPVPTWIGRMGAGMRLRRCHPLDRRLYGCVPHRLDRGPT